MQREARNQAIMQLTICQANGVKISGRQPRLADFYKDSKPKSQKLMEVEILAGFARLKATPKSK